MPDKRKTRSWFQVCGNLNVPLDGTKYGFIRSIAFEQEKVNAGAVGQQGKESARDSGRSAEGKQDAKTSRGLRNAAIESGRFCKTGAKKPAGEAGKYGNSLKAPYGDITGRSYPLSLTR